MTTIKFILNHRYMYLFIILLILPLFPKAFANPPCPESNSECSNKWAGGKKNMDGHYLKHKLENNTWHTTRNYTNAAVNAINTGESHVIINGPNRGRVMYYCDNSCSVSNLFVVTKNDSRIISAFKPQRGRNYFEEQIRKDRDGSGPGTSTRSIDENENENDIWTIYYYDQCNSKDENY